MIFVVVQYRAGHVRRLLREDVERRAGDAALVECLHQRVVVDQLAAAGVDQPRRRLHLPQLRFADHVPRLRRQHCVQRQEVGAASRSSSESASSTPSTCARSAETNGSYAIDVHVERPSPAAPPPSRRCPARRTPSVLPRSSTPTNCERFHSPPCSDAFASGMWRASASISAIVCSAVAIVLPSGALTTMTPRCVAASRSMLSTPTPARPTACSCLAGGEDFGRDLRLAAHDQRVVVADDAQAVPRRQARAHVDLAPPARGCRCRPARWGRRRESCFMMAPQGSDGDVQAPVAITKGRSRSSVPCCVWLLRSSVRPPPARIRRAAAPASARRGTPAGLPASRDPGGRCGRSCR